MSSAKIQLGFIGLSTQGWSTITHGPGLTSAPLNDHYDLVAISTTKEASAVKSGETWKAQAFYGDSSAIVNAKRADGSGPLVNMIAVAVPSNKFFEAAKPVLQAGKDLFIEWPVGRTLSEVEQLAELAKSKGVRTMVGLQSRQSPAVRKVQEIVAGKDAKGSIGAVRSVSVIAQNPIELKYWGPQVAEVTKRTIEEGQGSSMLDIFGGHLFDALTFMVGRIVKVSAFGRLVFTDATIVDADGKELGKQQAKGYDHVSIIGQLESGAFIDIAFRSTKIGAAKQLYVDINGEDGVVSLQSSQIPGAFVHIAEADVVFNGERIETEATSMVQNVHTAWAEFAKGADVGRYATLDEALHLRKLIAAIEKSIQTGQTVSVNSY